MDGYKRGKTGKNSIIILISKKDIIIIIIIIKGCSQMNAKLLTSY